MIQSDGITLSALSGFERSMEVTANNVANHQSEHYQSRRALMTEGAAGGIEVDISLAETGTPQGDSSNVDLAKEMPEAGLTSTYYDANLRVLSAKEEMLGTILDLIG